MKGTQRETLTLTAAERQFAALYFCGDNISTAAVIREALTDIYCPDVRAAAEGVIRKLEEMDAGEFADLLGEESRCA